MKKPLIETKGLKKYFKVGSSMLHAVDDINLSINPMETLGVVGESGCGKSTLGRVILGLLPATEGEVLFEGANIYDDRGKKKVNTFSDMQMIFQDPYSSLNPRLPIRDIVAEPIIVRKSIKNKNLIKDKVSELLDLVGLSNRYLNTYPHELDGGRRQRVGIARALALDPKFIVCDEPVSALDVSIQAQILNLLMDLQETKSLGYMFITHNLCVVNHISTSVMVMYMGKVVEKAPKHMLFKNPLHPYTKALFSAIPLPRLEKKREKHILQGEVSSPINPKIGCRFGPRCKYATTSCADQAVPLVEIEKDHFVACQKFAI